MASGRNKKKRKGGKAKTQPQQNAAAKQGASAQQKAPAEPKKQELPETGFETATERPADAEKAGGQKRKGKGKKPRTETGAEKAKPAEPAKKADGQPEQKESRQADTASADKKAADAPAVHKAAADADTGADKAGDAREEQTGKAAEQNEQTQPEAEAQDEAEAEVQADAEAEEQALLVIPEIPAGMTGKNKRHKRRKRHYVLTYIALLTLIVVVGSCAWIYRLFSIPQLDLFNVRQDVQLPNLVGLRWNDVKSDIEYRDFTLEKQEVFHESAPYGEVVDQIPRAPRKVKDGSRIIVKVSKGVETVKVPEITGWHKDTAKEKLRALGLTLMILPTDDDSVPPDCVIRTDPEPGTIVKRNTTVKMYVYREKSEIPYVTVPSCVGAASERDAGMRLTRNGLLMKTQYAEAEAAPGTIIEQSPRAGSMLVRGSVVTVTISKGPPPPPPPPPPAPEPEPEPESESTESKEPEAADQG